jgi:hypothetical protein
MSILPFHPADRYTQMFNNESRPNFLPLGKCHSARFRVSGSTVRSAEGCHCPSEKKSMHWCHPSMENGCTESPTNNKLEFGISE